MKGKINYELLSLACVPWPVSNASWFQFPDEGIGQTSRNRDGVDTLDFPICNDRVAS